MARFSIAKMQPNRPLDFWDYFSFLVPCLIAVEAEFIGRIMGSELLLAAALPLLLLRNLQKLRSGSGIRLTLLIVFWFLSQVATDIIVASSFEDFARGWSKIAFFGMNFLAILLLISGRSERVKFFFVGLACGAIAKYLFNPSDFATDYPWKFGYGYSVTCLILILGVKLLNRRKLALLQATLMLLLAVLNLLMEFRSLAALCFATFAFCAAHLFFSVRQQQSGTVLKNYALALMMSILISGYGLTQIYSYALNNGWFGESAMEKFEAQSQGDLGVLVGGRPEILISTTAILESPIIGYGSWARNPELAELHRQMLYQYGYRVYGDNTDDLIQTHSHLFGAWVEAGLGGGLLWLVVGWLLCIAIFSLLKTPNTPEPYIVFILFNFAWAILFSPLGAEMRVISAFGLALVVMLVDDARRSRIPSRTQRTLAPHQLSREASKNFHQFPHS